jgi:hypothetical protein
MRPGADPAGELTLLRECSPCEDPGITREDVADSIGVLAIDCDWEEVSEELAAAGAVRSDANPGLWPPLPRFESTSLSSSIPSDIPAPSPTQPLEGTSATGVGVRLIKSSLALYLLPAVLIVLVVGGVGVLVLCVMRLLTGLSHATSDPP